MNQRRRQRQYQEQNRVRTGEAITRMRERAGKHLGRELTIQEAADMALATARTWSLIEKGEKTLPRAMMRLFWFEVGLERMVDDGHADTAEAIGTELDDLWEKNEPR